MIVVDTSALLSVVLGENDAERYARVLADGGDIVVSAATWVEASIVVSARQGADGKRDLEHLIRACGARIVPMDEDQASEAVSAWERFGKGRHPAGLNLGDCFSYALATASDAPLLFKGDDFPQTDVRDALAVR